MKVEEIKEVLKGYQALVERAVRILSAGECRFDGVDYLALNEREATVSIWYWLICRGGSFKEQETVPIEWFSDGVDLKAEWKKKREAEREAAEHEARAEEKRKAAVRRRELAELKRLKAKYEGKEGVEK